MDAPETIVINGLHNSGFEWIADSTTNPPKYGAYWLNAFSDEEGDPSDRIEETDPFSGKRHLCLAAHDKTVVQKIACDTRWTDRIRIVLALQLKHDASLHLRLEDGDGFAITARFSNDENTDSGEQAGSLPQAEWEGISSESWHGISIDSTPAGRSSNWFVARLDAGSAFKRAHGRKPVPRLNLSLVCTGSAEARAFVDDLIAEVHAPWIDANTLSEQIMEKVIWCLETWYLPEDRGGLELVDPDTGYTLYRSYHIENGSERTRVARAGLHTVQDLLLRWLAFAMAQSNLSGEDEKSGWEGELKTWTPRLESFLRSLLEYNFDKESNLPCAASIDDLHPIGDEAVTVGAYIDFLMRASPLISDEALEKRCVEQARKAADRLLELQQAHDLPKKNRNSLKYNNEAGRFEGSGSNWYGLIPEKLTPRGLVDPPRRFNTSWAILVGRTFWYHYFKSAASIMAVHARIPDRRDMEAVRKIASYYHRDWDASRYDLENDTDDHYGYLCEDLLRIVEHGTGNVKPVLELLQDATDHRLVRDGDGADDTVWIQGVRLGTACAGDSPRALEGLAGLYSLSPDVNPISSGLPLYRQALLELARNDFKGRQMTNSQFTQSFFKNWEMVCICYRGSYQGDCREKPASFWHGDVGDTFGGPPTSAIYAQSAAYRVASHGERQSILSGIGTIQHVTDFTMKRRYGYLYGLDEAVAAQYGLPEKYVMGVSKTSAASLGYVMALVKLLPYLEFDQAYSPVGVELISCKPLVESSQVAIEVRVRGPAHGIVALPSYEGDSEPYPCQVSKSDPRIVPFIVPAQWQKKNPVQLDASGCAQATLVLKQKPICLIQPLLVNGSDPSPITIGTVLTLSQDQ